MDIGNLMEQFEQDLNPINFHYYKALNRRKIIINEEVSEDIIEKVVYPLLDMNEDGSNEEITLYVTSNGGNVYAGMLLADIINEIKTPLKIVGMGYCMSMGLLILMSGKNNPNVSRICYPSTVGLLHAGSIMLGCQDANQAKDFMDFNTRYEADVLRKHIINNTNISEKELKKISRKEKYLNANEMLELGVIDKIIGSI